MRFDIRKVDKYKNVVVEIENATFDLGLHDEGQCYYLAAQLIHASEGVLGEMPEEIGEAYYKIFEYLEDKNDK
jgi:hypothetical protein